MCANCDAVKGHIVINRIGVADKPVVGNDLDACFPGGLCGGSGSGAVVRADDENLDALGDQIFNIRFFLGGITLAEENLNIVTRGRERILEPRLVLYPSRLVLRRKNDTDR